MADETMFTLTLDAELRDQFVAEAEATDRPASQILREFVSRQREARGHDAWFRGEVEQAMRGADDPSTRHIPHEEVASNWRRQAELMLRSGEPTD